MSFNLTPGPVSDTATQEKKIREYRNAAEKLAQEQFSPGTRHLWMPGKDVTHDGMTQVHAFVLEGDHKDSTRTFQNAFELIEYYETPPTPGNTSDINRRLYIVQNPSSGICELLGVKIGIPPEVFLAHCDGFVNLSLVDDGFTQRDHSTYWKVPVPHRCICYNKVARPGKHYFHTGCIDREYVQISDELKDPVCFETEQLFFNYVSYWAKTYGPDGKSWTAIILVDSHDTRLRFESSNEFTNLIDFKPLRRLNTEVVLNRAKIETSSQPYARPFFNTLVSAHQAQSGRANKPPANSSEDVFSPIYSDDPFSITIFTQNLVRAAWEELIIRRDWSFRDAQLEDSIEHFLTREPLSTKKMLDRDYRNMEKYYEWVDRRRMIERWRTQLDTIMDAFNIHQSDEGHDRGERTWGRLQKKLAQLQADIDSHMEMFAQRAAFEQAFAANKQARSAGQLTKIATVIVPCTFVASIFSMGGDFAAGERLFSVYWAISVPVTLALLAWILHDDVQRVWKNHVSRKNDTSASRPRDSSVDFRRKSFAEDNDKVMKDGGA